MEFKLRYKDIAPKQWEALGKIPRTGWVKRGIQNPETFQAHTIACRKILVCFAEKLKFNMCEIFQILNMLEVHDYPKIVTGDMVNLTAEYTEKKLFHQKKFRLEYDAMIEVTRDLGPAGKEMFSLWLRFEKGEDKLSTFAQQIDKYQSIEKAWEYQQLTGKVKVQDFIDYLRNDITHPLLKENISVIEEYSKGT
ncbi:MAG TPA: HD domain-containing protein [Candidatus Paceibacterota bacterium]|nr:HD domain-containing protein [Candidatus Paceibacterota bacterium]